MEITYIPDTHKCFPQMRERLEANTAKFIAAREETGSGGVSRVIVWSDNHVDHIMMVDRFKVAKLLVGGGFVFFDKKTATVLAEWNSYSISRNSLQEKPADPAEAQDILHAIQTAVQRACSETLDDASPA